MDEATVAEYLDPYDETQGLLPTELETFGKQYRERGSLTRDQLYEIASLSSTRSAYHVESNPEERCREVTRNARSVTGDFSKRRLITGLSGFQAPTASCVLAAVDPDSHAVVDTRVWATLERFDHLDGRKESFDADDYVAMIEPLRVIATETGYTAAEVGYALFAYDAVHREGTLY